MTLTPGTRVRLRHDVDRYPHFVAPAGSLGTVTDTYTGGMVGVRMDDHLPGAETWDNEVTWSDGDDPLEDVEVLTGAAALTRRRYLTLRYDVTGLPDHEVDALIFEAGVQSETSDPYTYDPDSPSDNEGHRGVPFPTSRIEST